MTVRAQACASNGGSSTARAGVGGQEGNAGGRVDWSCRPKVEKAVLSFNDFKLTHSPAFPGQPRRVQRARQLPLLLLRLQPSHTQMLSLRSRLARPGLPPHSRRCSPHPCQPPSSPPVLGLCSDSAACPRAPRAACAALAACVPTHGLRPAPSSMQCRAQTALPCRPPRAPALPFERSPAPLLPSPLPSLAA